MAKKARTSKALGTVANRLPDAQTDAPTNMTEHDIARRAYELYLARDGEHGHDVYDWLQAERELPGETLISLGGRVGVHLRQIGTVTRRIV